MLKFKKGDWVEWTSQANGHELKKVGEIILVVPPNTKPYYAIWHDAGIYKWGIWSCNTHAIDPRSSARSSESYIVRVVAGRTATTALDKLYWPIVGKLQRWRNAM